MSTVLRFSGAAVLAMAASPPAWADVMNPDEKTTRTESESAAKVVQTSGSAVAGRGTATPVESKAVRAASDERLLRARHASRDGGL
jgi:hypothetical protein